MVYGGFPAPLFEVGCEKTLYCHAEQIEKPAKHSENCIFRYVQ